MKKVFPVIFTILMILTGCTSDTVDTTLYQGMSLDIGVIGGAPKVREDNIKFINITFEEIENRNLLDDFDAVFITRENLSEASDSKYAKIYKNAGIPFFFIESKKSYVPFLDEALSYEDSPDSKSSDYATGYFQLGEEGQSWGYGLYNNKINESNIKDVYSRIFTTILENQK
ncbi:hypothetical protein J2T13_002712 [Paenibacillus sp. DS2015]|uniref:hypothetical protein n=1 Tax=Paenibacillus sp. DS2015 TaxID=3373917 RepID=UPI003D1F792A